MIIVAIIGCAASGKSFVASKFKKHKASVVSLGDIMKSTQAKNLHCKSACQKLFKKGYCKDEFIPKQFAEEIYKDKKTYNKYLDVMLSYTLEVLLAELSRIRASNPKDHICILEAPGFFCSRFLQSLCSYVVLVQCSPSEQKKRLHELYPEDSDDLIQKRIKATEISKAEAKKAQYVIPCDKDSSSISQHVDKVLKTAKTKSPMKYPCHVCCCKAGIILTCLLILIVCVLLLIPQFASLLADAVYS